MPDGEPWEDAGALARMAGLELDEWQRYVLSNGLRRSGGKWSAFEVGLICSRQNGKGAILEALELIALFLLPDCRLILHSAHEFKTTTEHFLRIKSLLTSDPVFERRIARIRTQTGAEAIELRDGKRLRFVARSGGSGRGFSGDLIVLDEAQILGDKAMAALLPTLSARPDPQVWYTATAGTPLSTQLGRVRERVTVAPDPSLAFFEWSVCEYDEPFDPGDEAGWAAANPGLGIRISGSQIARERAALSGEDFARERLGIGLYPTDLADAWQVIPKASWLACQDSDVRP